MFAFDKALLPQISTRKALILVDFQNDFLEPDGALVSTDPDGFVNRALRLVDDFRGNGDIIWVQSQYKHSVPIDDETIIVSDLPTPSQLKATRGRGSRPPIPVSQSETPDPEAFLSQPEATCVKASSWGARMSPPAEKAVKKGDIVLTKSQYSAFQGTQLLMLLRAKMVMEVYICGALANVGVYATALDAAGHGMAITVVEDCCGYRDEQRQLAAVRNLIELTGCEIASGEEVAETFQSKSAAVPSQPPQPSKENPTASSSKDPSIRNQTDDSPDLARSMAELRLDGASKGGGGVVDMSDSQSSKDSMADSQKPQERQQEASENMEKSRPTPSIIQTSSIPESSKDRPQDSARPACADAEDSEEGQILQKGLCEGDTDIIENVLPEDLVEDAFDRLQQEVQWQRMLHQGGEVPRLVAVQGEVAEDGSMPVYRHPSDQSPPLLPFSPTVLAIKAATEKHLGHPLNHVLIQFYRDGKDYISEHSDKTIDVVKGSYVANVSLGAERTMVFRTKRQGKHQSRPDASPTADTKRRVQRAQLPHNSLCRMGLETNMKWLHSIRQDKRAEREKNAAELAFEGGRISLTFRRIGTFLDREEKLIWGQGAVSKTRDTAGSVINGQSPMAIEMLKAFGTENNSSTFDWEAHYGKGFDVLHISNAPRFFASPDPITNMRVALMLAEYGVSYAKGSMAPVHDTSIHVDAPIRFVDNDPKKSVVDGDLAIMLYLNAIYGASDPKSQSDLATQLTQFQRALKLSRQWEEQGKSSPMTKAMRQELAIWDELAGTETESGSKANARSIVNSATPSIADFALWPVLHAMVQQYGLDMLDELQHLRTYYEAFAARESTKKVVVKTEE